MLTYISPLKLTEADQTDTTWGTKWYQRQDNLFNTLMLVATSATQYTVFDIISKLA